MRRVQAEAVYESSALEFQGDAQPINRTASADYFFDAAESMDSWRYQYIKRAFDLSCAVLMIVAFLIPGLAIAAAILLTSDGPVFYREERVGRDGRLFQIWKFRSMYRSATRLGEPASHGAGTVLQWRTRKDLRDPRVTAVGGVLRRWSLDELPQLFNVLSGEMSLIGPRPIVEAETAYYGDLLRFYLAATPGLSGLWQVSGRSNVDYPVRVRLDAFYVTSWSLAADLNIFFRTIPAVLSRIGAR